MVSDELASNKRARIVFKQLIEAAPEADKEELAKLSCRYVKHENRGGNNSHWWDETKVLEDIMNETGLSPEDLQTTRGIKASSVEEMLGR